MSKKKEPLTAISLQLKCSFYDKLNVLFTVAAPGFFRGGNSVKAINLLWEE